MDSQTMMLSGLVRLKKGDKVKVIPARGFDALAACFGFFRYLFAGMIGRSFLVLGLTICLVVPGMLYAGFCFREQRVQKLVKNGWKIDNGEEHEELKEAA